MFIDFVYTLRSYGIPAATDQYVTFVEGLRRGLVTNLDELYLFARLCYVKRVENYDAYERAFAWYFYGVDLPAVGEGDPELLNTKQFRDWLRAAVDRGELRPVTHNLSREELMRRFWETVREQMSAHHGGNRWVGTGGTSPFGHSGFAENGVRVFGESRNRSATKVIGDRRYIAYSDDQTLAGGNVRQALATLKHLKPHGAPIELDVPETIHRTAKNGGEIELEFRPELRDRLEIALFLDNGGSSMLPFVDLTRDLFGKMQDRFKELRTFFFHNTIYDVLYADSRRTRGVPTGRFLREANRETRLIFVGDATMAPDELYSGYGAIDWEREHETPSIEWLRRLRERFPHSVWMNPIPREYWSGERRGPWTLQRIKEVFPMYDLTLGGIKAMVEYLSRAA